MYHIRFDVQVFDVYLIIRSCQKQVLGQSVEAQQYFKLASEIVTL